MPALVIIGNFDGVHVGHQAVLREAAQAAATGQPPLAPTVLTFHPHPAEVLGRRAAATLTSMPRKLELLRRVDPSIDVVVKTFDAEFAALSPRAFAESVLVGELEAKVVEVGQNFRFGKGRAGGRDELDGLGRELGFEARSHALVGDADGPYSSTRVREAIARGDLARAEVLLGRPHMLSGIVALGDRRGRTLGFPTANLGSVVEALPPLGVYAVLVDRASPERAEPARAFACGVANIGVRPTVASDPAPRVEVHLFDVNEDLYGAALRVHLVAHVRPERKFDGLEALKAQIAADAAEARRLLAGATPDPGAAGAWR